MQATVSNIAKARELQHKYLMGIIVTGQKMLDSLGCPCGGKLQFSAGGYAKCPKKCGHEFVIRRYEIEDNHATDENGDPTTYIRETVYCRRKMNGDYPFHIGELVTWQKGWEPHYGRNFAVTIGSQFYNWAEYTGLDAVFMVIGMELTGDRVLLAVPEEDGDGWCSISGATAQEITEETTFYSVQSFWCPIEYLESVSEWPVIDE